MDNAPKVQPIPYLRVGKSRIFRPDRSRRGQEAALAPAGKDKTLRTTACEGSIWNGCLTKTENLPNASMVNTSFTRSSATRRQPTAGSRNMNLEAMPYCNRCCENETNHCDLLRLKFFGVFIYRNRVFQQFGAGAVKLFRRWNSLAVAG